MEKILDLIYKGSTSLKLRDLTTTFQEMRAIIQNLQLVVPADYFQEVVGNPAIAAASGVARNLSWGGAVGHF